MNDAQNTNVPAIPSDFATRLMAGIAQSRATTTIGAGGKPILRLLKDGLWVFGQTNEEVQEGSTWVVNPMSLAHGWVCWIESTIAGQIMVSMAEDCPPRPAPIDGFNFEAQRSFDLKCLTGDDAGIEVVYKSSSMGGVEKVTDLIGHIRPRLVTAHPCPILSLEQEHYQSKKYGRIYKPVFTITGWADMNGTPEGTAALAAAPAAAPAPAPARKKKAPVAAAAAAAPPVAAAPPAAEPAPVAQPAPVAPQPTAAGHVGQRRRPGAR